MIRLLLFIMILVPTAFALDDTLPKGSLRFKTTVQMFSGEDFYNFDEVAEPILLPIGNDGTPADFEDRRLNMEISWGWDSRITIVFRTRYRDAIVENENGELEFSGVPDTYLAVRQRITPLGGDSRLIAETGVRLPVEADNADPLPLDSDGIDWYLITSYGQYFYPTRGGFDMDFGYRFRNGAPSDEVFFDTRLDLDLRRVALARLHFHVVESTSNGAGITVGYNFHPPNRGYQIIGIDFERQIGRTWTVGLGYQEFLEGSNQLESTGYQLSLTWQK